MSLPGGVHAATGSTLRIGTWNLAGRWDERHALLLSAQDCDIWLLAEVSELLTLAGYALHATSARMAARRHWAAVLSRAPQRRPAVRHRSRGTRRECLCRWPAAVGP